MRVYDYHRFAQHPWSTCSSLVTPVERKNVVNCYQHFAKRKISSSQGFCLQNYAYIFGLIKFLSHSCCCDRKSWAACAKLHTVAASNNRVHAPQSLLLLLARATHIVLFFAHIPFVVNQTINATPPERLQQCQCKLELPGSALCISW